MELFFGIAADGRTYPDASAPPGAVDFAVVGPAGLTDTLEVQLGIAGPAVPRSVRIAAYVAKIRAAGVVARFWSDSFSKDPWSTATMLLSLRDELVAGGWSFGPVGVKRIDDLAEVEIQGAPLPRGLADRVAALIPALSSRPGLRLVRLRLLEAR